MSNTANPSGIRRLTTAALLLALALVLPFLTGQIRAIGNMLCPMHFPVLLCGFICGWPWGLAVGMLAPILRSLLFGKPDLFPSAAAMLFELGTYGAASGILYRLLPKKTGSIYLSLIAAMLAGRIVWGLAQIVFLSLQGKVFTSAMFLAGAVTSAIPGMILQIILIPVLVLVLQKNNRLPD